MSQAGAAASPPAPAAAAGKMVVARFADGRTLKGTTHDFLPGKPVFHVHLNGNDAAKAEPIQMSDLKAVFFVKDFGGTKDRKDQYDFGRSRGYGRKVQIAFHDGEEMSGLTTGYNAKSQGFFILPADPDGNNVRIYVLNKAIKTFRWVP